MGGSGSLIATVFSSVLGSAMTAPQDDSADQERRAHEKERLREEAEERRKDRERLKEARALEQKRSAEGQTRAASLKDDPEVSGATLKTKLGD